MSSEGGVRVRYIEIEEDEQAIIRVRGKHHVSVIFEICTVDLFDRDGVVYTRHEYNNLPDAEHRLPLSPARDRYADSDADTECMDDDYEEDPMLWPSRTDPDPMYATPPYVAYMAGGHWDDVNEKHASRVADRSDLSLEEVDKARIDMEFEFMAAEDRI